MGIDDKLKIDMYAVLLLQSMSVLYVLFIKFESIDPIGALALVCIFIYALLMHIILTSNELEKRENLINKIKYYFISLLIINTVVLVAVSIKATILILSIIASLFTSYLTNKKISEAMKIKRYDNKSSIRYFIIIIAGLLGSYYPILGINLMYIVVSTACTYVYSKHAILQLEIKNAKD